MAACNSAGINQILTNQPYSVEMKNGFALIELSIVLVIIGLLISGILAGRSLVDSAKINAQVAQIQQFDAAVMAFKSKYKYLPGDAPSFGGDGDGVIDNSLSFGYGGDVAALYMCEIANFWNNIDPSSFKRFACLTSTQVFTSGANRNAPAAKLGKKAPFILASALTNGYHAIKTNPQNYYAILNSSQVAWIQNGWRLAPTAVSNDTMTPI